MINDENINKFYVGIIEGRELTTRELNSYGYEGLIHAVDNFDVDMNNKFSTYTIHFR